MKNLLALLSIVALCFGCNKYDIVAATDITDRELQTTAIIYTRCSQIGVSPVTVQFTDEKYILPDGRLAAMWAYGKEDRIVVWRGIVSEERKYPDSTLNAYAKHECAHCLYNHSIASPEVEAEADQCVQNWPDC